jgi:uncharacterized protein (DUF924 family)
MSQDKTTAALASPEDVIEFWLAAGHDKWFNQNEAFDAEIRARFARTHAEAAAGNLSDWETTPRGAAALIILLDQFSRNMFRGDARTYAADATARAVADRAIARGFDMQLSDTLRYFCYMPFMHSEALADLERCIDLFRGLGDAEGMKYAEHHADIVRRFGRFPHRNALLGRTTTPEEQAYLDGGGFGG